MKNANLNCCLKCCFIIFSVLMGIAGCLMILRLIVYTNEVREAASGLGLVYVITGSLIIFSILGTFGAYKEYVGALQMCLGLMVMDAMLLFFMGYKISQEGPQLMEQLQTHSGALKTTLLGNDLRVAEKLYKCCGLEGYTDYIIWGLEVPYSCECSGEDHCTIIRTTTHNPFMGAAATYKHVYNQPCLPFIDQVTPVLLRYIYGFAAVPVFGALLCIFLLWQIHYCKRSGGGNNDRATEQEGSSVL